MIIARLAKPPFPALGYGLRAEATRLLARAGPSHEIGHVPTATLSPQGRDKQKGRSTYRAPPFSFARQRPP
jgi:hypothetical protein